MWGLQTGMGWWMIFGIIIAVIFWGGIIWLIVWGVRSISHGGHRHDGMPGYGTRNNAMDILKERYAKGEITKEQFEQMKNDITY